MAAKYQIYDRYSFRQFLGLRIGDKIPDAKTIWLFKDQLANQGAVEKLFSHFGEQLNEKGYRAQKGQIIDASIIPVPKQSNSREENTQIKEGKIPEAWQEQPNKLKQKDNVYADSAYRSAAQEEKFAKDSDRSKWHHKGTKNKPLSEFKQQVNKNLSKVRAKVEHIFGNQMMMMVGQLMRCIGMIRAKACIGLRNLVYNMHRFAFLSKQKSKLA